MIRRLDTSLLLSIITLMGIGLVQVYSSSFIFATESFGDGLHFFERQLLFTVLSFFVMIVIALTPWQYMERWGWLLWMGAAGLTALT
ncbi:MAG: FtsW/RodA/SpoVE family cell cycle protein, partial [Pseudobdellovibrionaceae bacterium]